MILFKVVGITLGLLLVLSGVNFTVRAIGQGQDTPPLTKSVLPDENCTLPCWQGIQLGESTYEDARSILVTLPHASFHEGYQMGQFSPDGEHIFNIQYGGGGYKVGWISWQPEGVRLGDIMGALGQPAYILRVVDAHMKVFWAVLYYPPQNQIVGVEIGEDDRYSPLMLVASVVLYRYLEEPIPERREAWCGFHFPSHVC